MHFPCESRRGNTTPSQPRSNLVLGAISSEALKFFLGKKKRPFWAAKKSYRNKDMATVCLNAFQVFHF